MVASFASAAAGAAVAILALLAVAASSLAFWGRRGLQQRDVVQQGHAQMSARDWLCGFGADDSVNTASLRWADVENAVESSCGFVSSSLDTVRFALFKTHKTAGGTVAATLFRSATAKGLRWVGCDDKSNFAKSSILCESRKPRSLKLKSKYDFEMRHLMGTFWTSAPQPQMCDADGNFFDRVLNGYERLLGPGVHVFLPVRGAYSHLRSTLAWYQVPFRKFDADESKWNPLAKDLRLLKPAHVERFASHWPILGDQLSLKRGLWFIIPF
ncbi:ftsH [Symbiodinium natans]|uniref:FtsH protein n=1 Tax=Symbiodinium natans TaxID=878477 RepID=A0A812N9V9_9DINO|nr:ftsH [Symbiodinium natans]